jgi:hypothetical protein
MMREIRRIRSSLRPANPAATSCADCPVGSAGAPEVRHTASIAAYEPFLTRTNRSWLFPVR